MHPTNNDIVYAGGNQGLWKSTDGCVSWEQQNDESVNTITSYLRFDWDIMDNLALKTNLNYYHNSDLFNQKFRGGLTFQYKIKSGGK